MHNAQQNTQAIVEMRFGSHLYGTQTPQSDLDYKAVHLPTGRDIVLGRVKPVIQDNTKTNQRERNTSDDVDRESFALHKFLELVANGNTVALDMYFAPREACTKLSRGGVWDILKSGHSKEKLITKQCQSFLGYCRQQADKYGVKGSRMAAAQKAVYIFNELIRLGSDKKARLETVALCIEAELGSLEHVELLDIANPAGATVRHLSVCGRKVPYTATIQTALEVYSKLYETYGERSRQAKDNQGVDWKALSHAVRVGKQAIELLETGHITFPRPEAAHLVQIKTGQLSFDLVSEEIVELLTDVENAAAKSTLPEEADRQWIEDFVYNEYSYRVRWSR